MMVICWWRCELCARGYSKPRYGKQRWVTSLEVFWDIWVLRTCNVRQNYRIKMVNYFPWNCRLKSRILKVYIVHCTCPISCSCLCHAWRHMSHNRYKNNVYLENKVACHRYFMCYFLLYLCKLCVLLQSLIHLRDICRCLPSKGCATVQKTFKTLLSLFGYDRDNIKQYTSRGIEVECLNSCYLLITRRFLHNISINMKLHPCFKCRI